MKISAFRPPADLQDFGAPHRAAWSSFISDSFNDRAKGDTSNPLDSPRTQFFNPLGVALAADATEKAVTWSAFPKRIQLALPAGPARWRAADKSRDVQDEYCEWSVERDVTGKIKRVSFTCEPPEYWQFLAATDPDKTLALYREHVSPSVKREDLFGSNGEYIVRNHWNTTTTTGAMHLVQQANTLGAEIELAAAATVTRQHAGQPLTSEQDLIECSRYGDPQRHSDPHIGGEVNALARLGALITLADPVGLYMDGLTTAGWETPDGADPADFWRITRGTTAFAVRAVYEVTGHPYLVGDVKINGKAIQFGSQIAEGISMRLTGLAHQLHSSTSAPRECLGGAAVALAGAPMAAVSKLSVRDLIAPRPARRS